MGILLYYKKSSYEIYFLRKNNPINCRNRRFLANQIVRFKRAHDEHYNSLGIIEGVMRSKGVKYKKCLRGRKINDFSDYDIIITLGGDGTFLEAARSANKQLLLGVNSSPGFSVGNLCLSDISNFKSFLNKIIKKTYKVKSLCRLRLNVDHTKNPVNFLNDILIAHSNPATMSRYSIKIDRIQEEQRSSGLWVSTPSGSTGAAYSAGGKIIPSVKKYMQYIPRELYISPGFKYLLKGGILGPKYIIQVISLMRNGSIYVDGSHYKIPFPLGTKASISISPSPALVIC